MVRLTKAESIKQDSNPTCRECKDQLVVGSSWAQSWESVPVYLCKQCHNAYNAPRKAKRKTIKKERAIEHLGGKCKDCGEVYIKDVYDFHHRNPKEKDFSISNNLDCKWQRIERELDKCDLLCSNCHRNRHYKERIAA